MLSKLLGQYLASLDGNQNSCVSTMADLFVVNGSRIVLPNGEQQISGRLLDLRYRPEAVLHSVWMLRLLSAL